MTQESQSDPRLSFDQVADIYDEVRPRYPPDMFADLFRLLPDRPRVLEVGPGTGKATADLLGHGATVTAVEIGPDLARKLGQVYTSDDLSILVGDFETLELAVRSYDAVFAASAYHWVSKGAQLDRPAQLLRTNGLLAVVDLIQVTSPDDRGFFEAAQFIYDRYGEGHAGPPAPRRDQVAPLILAPLRNDVRFSEAEFRSYDWNQTYTVDEYRKLMLSYSGTQMMEPDRRQHLLDDIEAFINARFDGEVTRPLVATLTTARLAARIRDR